VKRAIIHAIVEQHTDDAGSLHHTRSLLLSSPAATLEDLAHFDERIEAHIDGLAVAGAAGWTSARRRLGDGDFQAEFAACVLAIESRDPGRLEHCFAVAEAVPQTQAVMLAAFNWVSSRFLQGTVAALINHAAPIRRTMGLLVCGTRGVDPGLGAAWFSDPSPIVRAASCRTAGEIGRLDLSDRCTAAMQDENVTCRFWGAWSTVILGDRNGKGLQVLLQQGATATAHRLGASALPLQAMSVDAAHAVLQSLARDAGRMRSVIQGCGIVGNSAYVPWLIRHMADAKMARVAGEAFSLITGVNLGALGIDAQAPEHVAPVEYAGSESTDPDEGLPWPDARKVELWWAENGSRFPEGVRFFVGRPVTRSHCLSVLRSDRQPQRILAANYLCLLEPGTPLFDTSAPAWRQQRLLSRMS